MTIPAELYGPMPPGNPQGPLDARRQARRDLLVRLRVEEHWTLARIADTLGLCIESVRRQLMKAGAGGRRVKAQTSLPKPLDGVQRIGATTGDLPDPPTLPLTSGVES